MNGLAAFLATATDELNNGINASCASGCNKTSLNSLFGAIANTLIFLVGAVSVIYIIIAGLKYVTANGDAKATESAKNTILFAVIGLVVAIASYAIVNFVVLHVGSAK
jgi:hypothetical protein